MKIIRALPILIFDKNFNYKCNEFKQTCYILIYDDNLSKENIYTQFDNILQINMLDIEENIYVNDVLKYEKPNYNEIKKIVDFINQHKDKKYFYVYCTAGVSRSGAVAKFLYNKFSDEIDKKQFRIDNKYINPNRYILKTLKKIDKNK